MKIVLRKRIADDIRAIIQWIDKCPSELPGVEDVQDAVDRRLVMLVEDETNLHDTLASTIWIEGVSVAADNTIVVSVSDDKGDFTEIVAEEI